MSVVVPAWNEAENLDGLIPRLHGELGSIGEGYEIIVADAGSMDGTPGVCEARGARYVDVGGRGYGLALRKGFAAARGAYVLTMDADFSHPAAFAASLWRRHGEADVIIASRFVPGGRADMPPVRRFLSRLLNGVFRRALHVPVRDLSSGFRLYRAAVLAEIDPAARDFDVLQEILLRAWALGFEVREVPFAYARRERGSSHARLVAFGMQYVRTFGKMWRLRNSIASGDYDRRAFDSRIPLQRWWQRRRHRIVTGWAGGGKGRALDVGCGSSRILDDLPAGSVGLDVSMAKLRHARPAQKTLVAGGLPRLPFRDGAFPVVVCSQVIEHIPRTDGLFAEFRRVLAPGGTLILGTPDYGRAAWRITEFLYGHLIPGGYADEHISRYTREGLTRLLDSAGFDVRAHRYVGGGELILKAVRSPQPRHGPEEPRGNSGRGRVPGESRCYFESPAAGGGGGTTPSRGTIFFSIMRKYLQ